MAHLCISEKDERALFMEIREATQSWNDSLQFDSFLSNAKLYIVYFFFPN